MRKKIFLIVAFFYLFFFLNLVICQQPIYAKKGKSKRELKSKTSTRRNTKSLIPFEIINGKRVIEQKKLRSPTFRYFFNRGLINELYVEAPKYELKKIGYRYVIVKKEEKYRIKMYSFKGIEYPLVKYYNNFYIPATAPFQKILLRLKLTKFDKDNIRILSLVRDTDTNKKIKECFKKKGKTTEYWYKANFENFFSENNNKFVFVLGHIENGKFVTTDDTGKKIFSISIDELNEMRGSNIIYPLGCNAASIMKNGPIQNINTYDTVVTLHTAIVHAKNFLALLENLSSTNCKLVLSENTFRQMVRGEVEEITFTAYQQTLKHTELEFKKIGQFDIPCVKIYSYTNDKSGISVDNKDNEIFGDIIIGFIVLVGIYFLIKPFINLKKRS